MFRSKTVVDGDNNSGEPESELTTNHVIGEGGGGEEAEAASMEKNKNREELIVRREGERVEAKPEITSSIKGNVSGGNRVGGTGIGVWRDLVVEEVSETAIGSAIETTGKVDECGDD